MRCTCGFESREPWVLCKVWELSREPHRQTYRIEICDATAQPLKIIEDLGLSQALDTIVEICQDRWAVPHIHLHQTEDANPQGKMAGFTAFVDGKAVRMRV